MELRELLNNMWSISGGKLLDHQILAFHKWSLQSYLWVIFWYHLRTLITISIMCYELEMLSSNEQFLRIICAKCGICML